MQMVEDSVNTNDLIPSLRAHNLLTDDETEELMLPNYDRREKVMKLLCILSTKGPLADLYFTHALADAVRENPVHREILERVFCQQFDVVTELNAEADIEKDSASTSRKRKRTIATIKPYATKVPMSTPRQVQAHGIILSDRYFDKINEIRRLHYLADWEGAEKIVEECRLMTLTIGKRELGQGMGDEVSVTAPTELYVAVALRNCSGYITHKMTDKVVEIVSEAKELCKHTASMSGCWQRCIATIRSLTKPWSTLRTPNSYICDTT